MQARRPTHVVGRRGPSIPVTTLRGKLRNVVGTLEVLESELDQIVDLADPNGNQDARGRGCPNEYDRISRHAGQIFWLLGEQRAKMRRFLSKPRSHPHR